mgnify:CR=1 FL=1
MMKRRLRLEVEVVEGYVGVDIVDDTETEVSLMRRRHAAHTLERGMSPLMVNVWEGYWVTRSWTVRDRWCN